MIKGDPSDYQVAIPSHQRAELLRDRTLALLTGRGVSRDRVTVFLDDGEPQQRAYQQLGVQVHVAPVSGINAMRRYIADHYPRGTPVLQVDDDAEDLRRVVGPKSTEPVQDVDQFTREAFDITKGQDLAVWGVSAVLNPFFMRDTITSDLKFVIGSFWGYFARPGHPVHRTRVDVKEDYETSLRAWWYDGGIVRFNGVAIKADHYRAPGGCQGYRDASLSAAAAEALIVDWPGLVRLNERRKSGHAEVLLNRKKRHDGHSVDSPPPGVTA